MGASVESEGQHVEKSPFSCSFFAWNSCLEASEGVGRCRHLLPLFTTDAAPKRQFATTGAARLCAEDGVGARHPAREVCDRRVERAVTVERSFAMSSFACVSFSSFSQDVGG